MNYEQFVIWLHGFLEISNAEEISKEQTQIIKDHLALLFEKKTPIRKEKKEDDDTVDRLKKLAEELEKSRPKDTEYPKYPPYAPIPMSNILEICKNIVNTELHNKDKKCC